MDDHVQSAQVVQRTGESPVEDSPPLAIEALDLQALAEEVVTLLREELWLEHERLGWRPVR